MPPPGAPNPAPSAQPPSGTALPSPCRSTAHGCAGARRFSASAAGVSASLWRGFLLTDPQPFSFSCSAGFRRIAWQCQTLCRPLGRFHHRCQQVSRGGFTLDSFHVGLYVYFTLQHLNLKDASVVSLDSLIHQ